MREVTADDSALMQYRFANGTVGNISLQIYGHGSKHKRRMEVSFLCEKGTLSIVHTHTPSPALVRIIGIP